MGFFVKKIRVRMQRVKVKLQWKKRAADGRKQVQWLVGKFRDITNWRFRASFHLVCEISVIRL
jgi:hypothetical protein